MERATFGIPILSRTINIPFRRRPKTFAIGPNILPSYCVKITLYNINSSYNRNIRGQDRNRLLKRDYNEWSSRWLRDFLWKHRIFLQLHNHTRNRMGNKDTLFFLNKKYISDKTVYRKAIISSYINTSQTNLIYSHQMH